MTIQGTRVLSSATLSAALPQQQAVARDDAAYRILVIGDLGAESAFHPPVIVDRDELDQVIARLKVRTRLQLRAGDPAVEISFSEFDDFHPDRLFGRLDVFEALRSRRQRLLNDATCRDEIAAILRSTSADSAASEVMIDSSGSADSSNRNSADFLAQILNVTQAAQQPLEQQVLHGTVDWDAYVRQLVAPYVVARVDPRQAEMIAGVDAAIADVLRTILHSSAFQRIEAIWTGIRFLTRRLETDRSLQLSVMHVSPGDLAADMLSDEDLTRTKLYRVLVDAVSAEGVDPWSLIVGDLHFGLSTTSCATLARIAKICEAAGAVFVSGAVPEIAGCPGFATRHQLAEPSDPRDWPDIGDENRQLWSHVRNHSWSRHAVLALPRMLARRPYGADSDPIESLEFAEAPDGTRHDQYLWMNAAFGIAELLGRAFTHAGHNFANDIPAEIERLPQHVFTLDSEEVIQPASEAVLSERAAERFAQAGLTVLRSVRNADSVRVAVVRTLSLVHPDLR